MNVKQRLQIAKEVGELVLAQISPALSADVRAAILPLLTDELAFVVWAAKNPTDATTLKARIAKPEIAVEWARLVEGGPDAAMSAIVAASDNDNVKAKWLARFGVAATVGE